MGCGTACIQRGSSVVQAVRGASEADRIDGTVNMLTQEEAVDLIRKALAIHDAERPVPTCVTVAEAAEMLGVSKRTAIRMKLPRNKAGKVPYRAVLEALAAK